MSNHQKNLTRIMGRGYFAHTRTAAMHEFFPHAADADFLVLARQEHDRLRAVEAGVGCALAQRDYAAAEQLKFIRTALAAVTTKK